MWCLCVLLCFMCFGFGTKFSGTDGYHTRTRASQTRPQTPATRSKLFLRQLSARSPGRRHSTSRAALAQEKCGPTGGPRSARRRDPTRRRALPPRRRALSPPPSGPAAATLRGLRLELLADGRLQRARIRHLRTPTCGICRRLTGVFRAPTRGLSAGRFP